MSAFGPPTCPAPRLIARECRWCRYKGKKVHVIFFGDDTEAWIDIKKMKSPFLDHLKAHGKNKRVVVAVEQAQVWLSESAADDAGDDGADAESGMADGDGDDDDAAAPDAAATGDEEQAASAKTTTEADSESGETVAPPVSADHAKQSEPLGDGGGDNAGTGGDEDEDEQDDDGGDEDEQDDDDDDDSELSLSEDSDDDGPAFELKSRKSAKPAAKRKASARGTPSAKRSRNGGAARRVPKEKEHDDPVPEAELRDAPVTELASLRAQADEGISSFAEASTVVDSLSAARLKLQAKLDKVKKQEKQATRLQQDAKAKIRKALKDVAGCKMTVSALKETKWGKTVKKLSKFEGDANISKVADAQLNRWKATVSDASVASAETQQKQSQGADEDDSSPQPAAVPAADGPPQAEPPQQAEINDSQGNGQGAGSTVAPQGAGSTVAPQEPAQTLAAPSGDAEAEAAASEKLRTKVICRLGKPSCYHD
eukprot:COSAG02_NODE_8576_length_2517_cov_1.779156_2_plen_483_part_00